MGAFDGKLEAVFACCEVNGIADGKGAGVNDASVVEIEVFVEERAVEGDVKNPVIRCFGEPCSEPVVAVRWHAERERQDLAGFCTGPPQVTVIAPSTDAVVAEVLGTGGACLCENLQGFAFERDDALVGLGLCLGREKHEGGGPQKDGESEVAVHWRWVTLDGV